MKRFVIVGDSTCDLNKELREQYGIEYVKMNYEVDGIEYVASLDWEQCSSKEYYDLMRRGATIKTTQVPRDEYVNVFSSWIEKGYDVLYVSCSSGLSGSIGLARVVAEELCEKYPEAKIVCVDSLISSLGQGMLLIKASELREQGLTIDEVGAWLEENKLCVNQCGTVESLEYLRRAGRVKATSAFFGNIFGVKPIIISDIKGMNYAYRKVKGAGNARKEMAKDIIDVALDIEDSVLYISHADNLTDCEKYRDEILSLGAFKDVRIGVIGPIVGASVGPGTLIAFAFGKKVTIEGKE